MTQEKDSNEESNEENDECESKGEEEERKDDRDSSEQEKSSENDWEKDKNDVKLINKLEKVFNNTPQEFHEENDTVFGQSCVAIPFRSQLKML